MDFDREQYINSVNLNIDTNFPYLVLDVINDNAFPRNPGFHVMHWHEDLQFILVLDGTIEVQTLDTSVLIRTGEGLFINKNVVHNVRRLENCHYNSFLFPAYFLEFYAGSPAKDFVNSVTSNDRMAFIHFTTALDWHKEVIAQLKKLVQIEKNKTDLLCIRNFSPTLFAMAGYEKTCYTPAGTERKHSPAPYAKNSPFH